MWVAPVAPGFSCILQAYIDQSRTLGIWVGTSNNLSAQNILTVQIPHIRALSASYVGTLKIVS